MHKSRLHERKAIVEVVLSRSRLITEKNGNNLEVVKGKGIDRRL